MLAYVELSTQKNTLYRRRILLNMGSVAKYSKRNIIFFFIKEEMS